MLDVKKKTDKLFCLGLVGFLVIAFIVSLFISQISFLMVLICVCFGFIAASFVQYKDAKSFDNTTFEKKIVFNLFLNLLIYGLFFYASMYLYEVLGVVICAVTLIMYRSLFFKLLAKEG